MNHKIVKEGPFSAVEITLNRDERVKLARGSMVYHSQDIVLEGKMNSNGATGVGGAFKAIGRAMSSGEGMFMTTATSTADGETVGIAPDMPGAIRELKLGEDQWRLNDGAFLACDDNVNYEMKKQSLGKAVFSKTGGLFVMETYGEGSMLINSYGEILEFELDGSKTFVVDNSHVLAWSTGLTYEIKVGSGTFGFKTGEGLVNQFSGKGTVLVQTRNVRSLASAISPYISSGSYIA